MKKTRKSCYNKRGSNCIKTLIHYLTVVEDSRDIRRKKYKFSDILIMTIYGILNKEMDCQQLIGQFKRGQVYREENNNFTVDEHYFIMDTKININYFVKAIRNHWNIETGLHWKLDVIFDEDHQRNRIGNSIENLATIRKIVFNLVRLDNSFDKKVSLNARLIH